MIKTTEKETKGAKGADAGVDPNCGYYLRQDHRLIRRHEEVIVLNADNTARWQLTIDFALPGDDEACWTDSDGTRHFVFPLLYLKKNEARPNLLLAEEGGAAVHRPIRKECDDISTAAIAQAITALAGSLPNSLKLDPEALKEVLERIPAEKAYRSSMALQKLRSIVGISGRGQARSESHQELGALMVDSGLDEMLEMLVEHSMIWVALRGQPNERRSITVSQDIAVNRRAFLRWSFGRLTKPRNVWRHPRRAYIAAGCKKDAVLTIGEHLYGRRDRRISFSALGERLGQPLAWMPYEFEVPTIYGKRCSSYHFEVRCSQGWTPRDLRVSHGPPLAEKRGSGSKAEVVRGTRKTLSTRAARCDIPGQTLEDVIRFRVTVGIGDGAFPILWFLVAGITATMLWVFAGTQPVFEGDQDQIAAGILLIVPALVAALAIGSNEVPVSQLVGAARILLLVTGLSAVVAASVLTGAEPFQMKPEWTWSACAMASTAAAIPLATSWFLASPLVWRRLMALDSYGRQLCALVLAVCLAILGALGAGFLGHAPIARAAIAGLLLFLAIFMSAVAIDRAAVDMGESRRYIAVSFIVAGLICVVLACIELRAVVAARKTGLQDWAEYTSVALLAGSLLAGPLLNWLTSFADPRPDEVHVSPREGRALLAEESVRELPILFERERTYGTRAKDGDDDR